MSGSKNTWQSESGTEKPPTPHTVALPERKTRPLNLLEHQEIASWVKKSIDEGALWAALQPSSMSKEEAEKVKIQNLFETYLNCVMISGAHMSFRDFLLDEHFRDDLDSEKIKEQAKVIEDKQDLYSRYMRASTQIRYGCPTLKPEDFEVFCNITPGRQKQLPIAYRTISQSKPKALLYTSFEDFKTIVAEVIKEKLDREVKNNSIDWKAYIKSSQPENDLPPF